MSGFNFVVAYLLLSAIVLWRKELKQKVMEGYQTLQQKRQAS